MPVLILGLLLWVLAHTFKRMAPGLRARMGDAGKGLVAALILLGVLLMVIGYRQTDFIPIYNPFPGAGHLNNTLMLISVFLFGVGGTKGTLYTRMRHPMLWGTVVWAVAHLLVNGDLASIVLFGCLAIWAFIEMSLINGAGPWLRPVHGRGLKGDAMNLVGTVVIIGVAALIHQWLGHPVFLGNY
ncbi:NnrU family protein [Fuscibacter oryzae]|uniref:NnrU domain-containing protein n=1 Tax=Fuscibacter oryzae TaxID=2803939 RepID=A0A8J7MUK9_9RHOB|nr:NnrU family protein [Fuscibacter oryzae]MBL4929816.1 hypothetical protein [Fuscibacter oryzae]